jgi:hypothetical protein
LHSPAYFATAGFPCPIDFNPAEYFIDLISETTSGGQRVEMPPSMLPPSCTLERLETEFNVKPSYVKQQEFRYDDTPKQVFVMDRTIVRKIDVERIEYLLKHYDDTVHVGYQSPEVNFFSHKITTYRSAQSYKKPIYKVLENTHQVGFHNSSCY